MSGMCHFESDETGATHQEIIEDLMEEITHANEAVVHFARINTKLIDSCKKLANEAAGFLALSDVERHGMTNSRILRDRIEQARDVIREAEMKP